MLGKPSSHIKVAKYYQVVWKSALGKSKTKAIPEKLIIASHTRNFSAIETLIKKFEAIHPHEVKACVSIGCGAARDLQAIKALYPWSTVVGIDTSPIALLEAKKVLSEGNFVCASISRLPLRKEVKFDTTIAGHVLEYFSKSSLKEILSEVSQYVTEGSRFYVTFWEKSKDRHKLDQMFFEIELNLMQYEWNIVHADAYCYHEISPLAEGGFIVANKTTAPRARKQNQRPSCKFQNSPISEN